jgi:hypothetical protein
MTSPHEIYEDRNGDAVVVCGTTTMVEFHAQGGGFIQSLPEDEFHECFKLRTDPPPFTKVIVTGDWDYETIYEAYSNGVRWNGWVVPYFTKDTALAVMATIPGACFEEGRDCFTQPSFEDDGGVYVALGVDIAVDGQFIHVYHLFDGWCWELAEVQP